ncbi:fibropellin-1 isoform X2 [Patella vulgata]|uniref:fibropellin-1 isoform X2 n=1 Tax=Patella vulgata TaxID=6465 RepID=UPI0021804579|nr:fibropellin-1 isoform X2 [Patella vulgata]
MRVIFWIALVLTTVVTVSGQRSWWPWPREGGMKNPRCISCTEVKEAHLCENCCKVSVCDPDPCKNDGMCSPADNGYICSCTPGYLGENCDVNVCLPNPCKNDGTCSPVDNGYSCNCTTGYLGKNCDVNPCDAYNPCVNNGTCYPSEFVVNCSCLPGFIGAYCEVDLCDPSPCNEVGDTCFRVDGGFECRCTNIVNDGIITSPNYPQYYPGGFGKCYVIIGRPGQNITLTLDAQYGIELAAEDCDVELRTGVFCVFDYLKLQGVRYCGGVPPDPIVVPTGENTTVRFTSDYEDSCIGFNLSITYTDV